MQQHARTDEELFHELTFYTLALSDPSFLHQHAVDAYAAQHATESSRPIYLVFALVGLYLHVEKGFSGRSVQKTHMRLAGRPKTWPRLPLPQQRGSVSVADVLGAAPGAARNAAIHTWSAAVWDAFRHLQPQIAALLLQELDIR